MFVLSKVKLTSDVKSKSWAVQNPPSSFMTPLYDLKGTVRAGICLDS